MLDNTLRKTEIDIDNERLFDTGVYIPVEEQLRIINALNQQGIDIFTDEWMVTHWASRRSGRAEKLFFSDTHFRIKHRLGWFRNYAKYLTAIQRLDKSVGLRELESWVRVTRIFADYLLRFDCNNLGSIDSAVMEGFERDVFTKKIGDTYKSRIFSKTAEILRALNLNIEWKPPILHADRFIVEVYSKNQKEKRPPFEVILQFQSVAKTLIDSVEDKMANATWTLKDTYDLCAAGAAIICLGTNARIQEVLCLSTECEYFGNGSWEPDAIEEKMPEYGIIMYIEKPTRANLKAVVPEYASVIHEIIKCIKKVTEVYRQYARYWESRGEIQYVLNSKTQKFSESLFCFCDCRLNSAATLTEKIVRMLSEDNKETINSFCRTICGGFRSKLLKSFKIKYNDLYKKKSKYDLPELCKVAFGTGRLFGYDVLSTYLHKAFPEKYSILHDGKPYCLNFHQTRHFTTTVMSNNGIDINLVDSLHGRQSRGQSAVYDHPTDAEVYQRSGGGNAINKTLTMRSVEKIDKYDFTKRPIEINCDMRTEILNLFKKGLVTGPKAKAYQKLIRDKEMGKITKEELEYMEWQYFPMVTVAPIRLGLCTHSWYENPCDVHYNCLLDAYGKSCKSLAPFVHPKTLQFCDQIQRDLNLSIELARKREASEYRDRWIQNLESKSDHCKQIKSEIGNKLEHMQNGFLERQNLLEDVNEEKDV